MRAALGSVPRWFQLYWSRDDDLVTSFVRRAEAAGCSALVVTLDTHSLGWRPGDLDLAPAVSELAQRRAERHDGHGHVGSISGG